MKRGIIEQDPRSTSRSMRLAIQGDVIRGLVELITNADDSYIRMEKAGLNIDKGQIDVLYRKSGYDAVFSVRDFGEGMSSQGLVNSFTKRGSATSGLFDDIPVRGYFGHGAKDVLATMKDGKVISFKDGRVAECRLFIEGNEPRYELLDSTPANEQLQSAHQIFENGTIVYFTANKEITGSPIPRFGTVRTSLCNNYLLRNIMTNQERKIRLINLDTNEEIPLSYILPIGSELKSCELEIEYGHYRTFNAQVSIWRADDELTQNGMDRDGGLCVMDEHSAVLDCSLYKYDNDPIAGHLFGSVVFNGFRQLLLDEVPVLDDRRNGLARAHGFCQSFITKIELLIKEQIEIEESRKRKEREELKDPTEQRRYKDAMDILNEIAKAEVEDTVNLSRLSDSKDIYPTDGFCIYPSSAEISLGKKYSFEIRYDTQKIRPGTILNIEVTNPRIRVSNQTVSIPKDEPAGINSKFIKVEGLEPQIEGVLTVSSGNRRTEANIFVLAESGLKDILYEEGLLFQPESVTLRPNEPQKVHLLVYTKMIETGSIVTINSDNKSVHVSDNSILVNEADAERNVAKYELEIWGEGHGQDALISAEYLDSIALMDVRTRSKEQRPPRGPQGMFSEPEFIFEENPLQPMNFSKEKGKVMIYVNFPTVLSYLGPNREYSKSLVSQVFIANSVMDKCFNEIAARKVESIGMILTPATLPYTIAKFMNELLKEYGAKVQRALVDQSLLKQHLNASQIEEIVNGGIATATQLVP